MKEHPIYKRYWATKNGRIWSDRSNRFLKPQLNSDGHLQVEIKGKSRLWHRFILECFVGFCPQGRETRHLDGNPKNNHINNLCWGTHSENVRDAVRHQTHVNQKLNNDEISFIHYLWNSGLFSKAAIARYMGVTRTVICSYINKRRRTWI